ncbi:MULTISPECIES: hypothetical protein [unclassified Pedobacter]|jgi:hypothetical protein|uniref:hypothetical protein n=1 Tax=Pedobacter TaxID=84567 RepID=UPI001C0E966F|nr:MULTISPECIES: hypothetical protein [unclassified Pedobacter]MCX2431970.1 hypothetical protein [Pedobacter sp. GR22-10]
MRHRKYSKVKKFIFFLPVVALIGTAIGYTVMSLWNWILPEVAHAGRLNFWQALGLLVLCRLLFGNFNKGGRNRFRENASKLRSKWQNMNEEERAKFKEEYKNRCSSWRKG